MRVKGPEGGVKRGRRLMTATHVLKDRVGRVVQ